MISSEGDKRLDDAVLVRLHETDGTINLGERNPVRRHATRVSPTGFNESQQSTHAASSTRAKSSSNGLIPHSPAPEWANEHPGLDLVWIDVQSLKQAIELTAMDSEHSSCLGLVAPLPAKNVDDVLTFPCLERVSGLRFVGA